MSKINEYLKDNDGKPSFMRLASYVCLWLFVATLLMQNYAIFFREKSFDVMDVITLDFLLAICVFIPKYLQKFVEMKNKQ